MRQEWGCTYFKLDGNFLGRRYTAGVSMIRALLASRHTGAGCRRYFAARETALCLVAIIRSGLRLVIHGSRSSNDIKRSWDRFETTARQNLSRNWQNGRLWWNDPDALVLTGELSDDEFSISMALPSTRVAA